MTVLSLVGPTAVGKTAAALEIAERIGAEVVSVDSMQVYRGMDIGTSKPSRNQRGSVRFHLVDVVDHTESFSAAAFKRLADSAIMEIHGRESTPLLVGGSGLYYRAVVDDLDFSSLESAGSAVELEREFSNMADSQAHHLLSELDPGAAAEIPPENRRRVLKAIEVARSGKRLMSDRQRSWSEFRSPYRLRSAGLVMDRGLLAGLIDQRVDEMMSAGLEREVAHLRALGLRRGTTAGEAIGYRQLLDYLDGGTTLERAVDEIKARTRSYARRQLTWFRKDPRTRWFLIEGGPGDTVEQVAASRRRAVERILEYLADNPEN